MPCLSRPCLSAAEPVILAGRPTYRRLKGKMMIILLLFLCFSCALCACYQRSPHVLWSTTPSGISYRSFWVQLPSDVALLFSRAYREPGVSPRKLGEPSRLAPARREEFILSYQEDAWWSFPGYHFADDEVNSEKF